jgi:hypothetical protein
MRSHKVLNYESILQVLGETGCPFCRFMKNFQMVLLQDAKGEVHHLCNFHTWGLAATQQAVSAAEHFTTLLREQSGVVPGSFCTICTLLQEEDLRIREFIGYSEHKLVAQSLRSHAVLCMVHWAKLKHGAPPILVSAINSIMERCRRQFAEDVTRLHSEYLPDAERWGVLGRVAEFMVSQRGLHT